MTASITSLAAEQNQRAQRRELGKPEGSIQAQPRLAIVAQVDPLGRIKAVLFDQQTQPVEVVAQAQHITPTKADDSVLVQHTSHGWVVLAVMAGADESPAAVVTNNKGHVQVKGAKSVTLMTAKGCIEVHQDGQIVLDATELTANSERDLTLAGWPIRLN